MQDLLSAESHPINNCNDHALLRRVHEMLDTTAGVKEGDSPSSKMVGWEVQVVESGSNWSAKLHQHSRSSEVQYISNSHPRHTE